MTSACQRERKLDPPKAIVIRADKAIELNVMSFNVRYENNEDGGSRSWRQRVIGSVRMIRRECPDLLGVQEALHGQVADLWASLPDYEFFGVGRDDAKKKGEYSGIFYNRDRFNPDPEDHGTFWLSGTPEVAGSHTWGNEIPRVAAWVRLIDRATGRGFYFFNTHWDHKNQSSRERAALLISRRIDDRKHPEDPVVLTGDFNSTESNPGSLYLTGRKTELAGTGQTWPNGLVDTYQTLHPKERNRRTLHFWSDSREGLVKVDHILVSKGAETLKADIISGDQPMVSDHYPVESRVLFPAGEARR